MSDPDPITLCLDIGGSGIKGLTADASGHPTSERVRLATPRPATPEAVLEMIAAIIAQLPAFTRIGVGFPGVVIDGTVLTAPNLHPGFAGFALAAALRERTGRPARVANDAGVQGLADIEGRGTEVLVALGTGMGFGLYVDGRYVPNIELAHHPFRKRKTYEDMVGHAALVAVGRKRWNRRVEKVIEQLEPVFNYRMLYLGGGNAKLVSFALPPKVKLSDNVGGLLGCVKLWAQPAGEGAGP